MNGFGNRFCNHLKLTTIINHYQPLSTIINHYQPTINQFQYVYIYWKVLYVLKVYMLKEQLIAFQSNLCFNCLIWNHSTSNHWFNTKASCLGTWSSCLHPVALTSEHGHCLIGTWLAYCTVRDPRLERRLYYTLRDPRLERRLYVKVSPSQAPLRSSKERGLCTHTVRPHAQTDLWSGLGTYSGTMLQASLCSEHVLGTCTHTLYMYFIVLYVQYVQLYSKQ